MIVVCGGVKGGGGKTTLATHLAIARSLDARDVLLIDGDPQQTASDFSLLRSQLPDAPPFTSVQLRGSAIRSEGLRLAPKHDDTVIDVGGRDSSGLRAALSFADVCLVPFLPSSFDLWALEQISAIVADARSFNPNLRALCCLNQADPRGSDNLDAAAIAREQTQLLLLDLSIGNRKVFRHAAAAGLSVLEFKPRNPKAVAEILALSAALFSPDSAFSPH